MHELFFEILKPIIAFCGGDPEKVYHFSPFLSSFNVRTLLDQARGTRGRGVISIFSYSFYTGLTINGCRTLLTIP